MVLSEWGSIETNTNEQLGSYGPEWIVIKWMGEWRRSILICYEYPSDFCIQGQLSPANVPHKYTATHFKDLQDNYSAHCSGYWGYVRSKCLWLPCLWVN